jgi:hypothetical protein
MFLYPAAGGGRMGYIFISYRRDDSQFITDRIFDHLTRYFSRKSLFKDVDNIPVGVDFRTQIDNAVRKCAVMLAIIGPGWLLARDAAGQRRLDDPADSVCLELSSALRLQRPIIPVLVGGAGMPAADELPLELKPLAYINAVKLRSDPDFTADFARLRRALQRIAGRGYRGWITPMAVAAAALGVVLVVVWYTNMGSPFGKDSGGLAHPMPVPERSAPVVPSTTPANGCIDVPFTDASKIPPVTTTMRVCG